MLEIYAILVSTTYLGGYKKIRELNAQSQETVANGTRISRDKIGAFERNEKTPDPDEIVALSEFYNSKRLCRWYCSEECPVGKEIHLLPVDALEEERLDSTMLVIINSLNKLKNIDIERMVEISVDGKIDKSEIDDFNILKSSLASLAQAYGALLRIEEDGHSIYHD